MNWSRQIETLALDHGGIQRFHDKNVAGGANAYFLPGHRNQDYLIDCLSGAQGANLWETIQPFRTAPQLVILLTHTHADHAGGLADFPIDPSITVYVHPSALQDLTAGRDRDKVASLVSKHMKIAQFDKARELFDGQLFPYGEGTNTIKCLLTPGHSSDSVCFSMESLGILFTGDTFYNHMKSTLVKYTFGSYDDLLNTWDRLSQLQGIIVLYPGHFEAVEWEQFLASLGPLIKKVPRKRSKMI